ncbi:MULTISPECIES: hypothetical protein [unclassified Microcoleus]
MLAMLLYLSATGSASNFIHPLGLTPIAVVFEEMRSHLVLLTFFPIIFLS